MGQNVAAAQANAISYLSVFASVCREANTLRCKAPPLRRNTNHPPCVCVHVQQSLTVTTTLPLRMNISHLLVPASSLALDLLASCEHRDGCRVLHAALISSGTVIIFGHMCYFPLLLRRLRLEQSQYINKSDIWRKKSRFIASKQDLGWGVGRGGGGFFHLTFIILWTRRVVVDQHLGVCSSHLVVTWCSKMLVDFFYCNGQSTASQSLFQWF